MNQAIFNFKGRKKIKEIIDMHNRFNANHEQRKKSACSPRKRYPNINLDVTHHSPTVRNSGLNFALNYLAEPCFSGN